MSKVGTTFTTSSSGDIVIRRTPYTPAIDVMIDGWDGGDAWGSALSLAFALADVAYAAGVDEVGSILDYTPGMGETLSLDEIADGTDDDTRYEAVCLAEAYISGDVTDDDLVRAAKVLSRYLDLCKRAGLDY